MQENIKIFKANIRTITRKVKTLLSKIKVWSVDHVHLLFKSAAHNHLRIQKCKVTAKEGEACNLDFGSYTELKKYQKKVRLFTYSASSTMASVLIAIIVMQVFFPGSKSLGATYTWAQNSWAGGADAVTTATHDLNKTNWNKFFSKDANVAATSDVKLTATNASVTQTTDTDFNAGVFASVSNSGAGVAAKISLAANGGSGVDGNFDLSLGAAAGGCNGAGLSWSNPICTINTATKSTFNFTNINIPAGTTLKGGGSIALILNSSGNVQIDGIIDVSGTSASGNTVGVGGPGGFNGGSGTAGGFGNPGGGVGGGAKGGAGGGHGGVGGCPSDGCGSAGGISYNTDNIGGSGGAGSYSSFAGGGGGGSIKIVSSNIINIGSAGAVYANAGNGAAGVAVNNTGAGGGAGGRITFSSMSLINAGTIQARGGIGGAGVASWGAGGGGGAGGRIIAYNASGTISGAGTSVLSGGVGAAGTNGSTAGASAVGGTGGASTISINSILSYSLSGIFTSNAINSGQKSVFSTISFNKITPANTALTIDVRGGNTATPDGTWTAWQTDIANSGDISSLNGNQYVQYRANLSTTNTAVTPQLDDVTFNYKSYPKNQTATSSIDFTLANEGNFVQENALSGTDFLAGGAILGNAAMVGTGGVITTSGLYNVHTFNTSGTFSASKDGTADALIVAGGGGGGAYAGGGGGAGGYRYLTSLPITSGAHVVTVGNGGVGGVTDSRVVSNVQYYSLGGSSGQNSSLDSNVSIGGGGGGGGKQLLNVNPYTEYCIAALAGGSGGGGCHQNTAGGLGTAGQGFAGGLGVINPAGGGGGGAGGVGGNNGGAGGVGVSNSISGAAVFYAGGGGGKQVVVAGGSGGNGGGGNGAINDSSAGSNGSANKGGGGGGGGAVINTGLGGNGGSGVVIIKYLAQSYPAAQASYITTSSNSQKNTSTWGHISGVTLTQTTPTNTTLKYLVSFDNRATWKYWNGSAWTNSALANLETDGMVKATVEGISQAQWETTGGFKTISNGTLDFAVSMKTTDVTATPTLSNINVAYEVLPPTIVSTPYDTTSQANVLSKVKWSETLPALTDVKFQVRTSPDNATWTAWMGTGGDSTTYFTAPDGSETMPAVLSDGANDEWIQYRAFLTTNDTSVTPTLSSATLEYVVNAKPEFDPDYPTNGVGGLAAIQDAGGSIKIDYSVRDTDTTTGNVVPTYYYSLNNGATYFEIVSGLSAGATTSKTVDVSSYTPYSVTWNAGAQLGNNVNVANAKIRVSVSDAAPGPNTTQKDSAAFTLNTMIPILGAVPIKVDASTVPATVTLDASDVTALEMKVSTSPTLAGASWEPYSSTKTITLSSAPATVYAQVKNANGFSSIIFDATTPEVPASMMAQDTSNLNIVPSEFRLFTAWKVAASPAPGFASYNVYRSPDQTTWTPIGTITDRLTNYYGDSSVAGDTNFYYRVTTNDTNGNISSYSSIVNGKANGLQDAGEGGGGTGHAAPIISAVTVDQITNVSARINWTTDIISNSTVGYSTTAGVFTTEIGTGSMVTDHHVTISSLSPNTAYFFQVKSIDSVNALTVDANGINGYTFSTTVGDVTAPTISNINVGALTASTATITWDTDENSDSFIEYSKTNNFTKGAFFGDFTFVASPHSVTIPSLEDNTTYYFKVHSKDASNNERISAQQTFQTDTSGDVTAPIISAIVSTPSFNSAGIVWTTDENSTSYVEYGLTNTYGKTFGDGNLAVNHNVQLPYDLTQNTLYYYRVHSTDGSGNEAVSSENTFTTVTNPGDFSAPVLSSITVGLPGATSANITWTTNENATSFVGYSIDGGNTFDQQGSGALGTFHSVTLVGLAPNTSYLLKVISTDASGNTATADNGGAYYSAVTSQGPQAPTFSAITASTLSFEGATITWNTNNSSTSFVEYGLTASYGESVGKHDNVKTHSIDLKNLLPAQTYHFRVRSTDQVEGISLDYTFSTATAPDTTPAAIDSISSSLVTKDSAKITWHTNENSNSVIHYGPTISYSGIAGSKSASENDHDVNLDKLEASTTYHYQIQSTDDAGNFISSADQTFTTLPDGSTLTISNVSMLAATQTSAVISWDTNKDASTKIIYSKDHGLNLSSQTLLFGKTHYISITGLEKGTKYYYKVVSVDALGNEQQSDEKSFDSGVDASLDHPALASITFDEKNPSMLTDTAAVIAFETDQVANCFVEYGVATGAYSYVPVKEKTDTFNKVHAMALTGMLFSTKHYYKVTCQDNLPDASEVSADEKDFTTLDKLYTQTDIPGFDSLPPTISNVKISSIIGEGAVITWDTDEKGSSVVGYGITTVEENGVTNQAVNRDKDNFTVSHSVTLTGLIPATKYIYMVSSTDASGNISQSSEASFTTASPSSLSSIKVESKNLGEATVTWKTEQETTSMVEYGLSTSYGEKKENNAFTKEHSIQLSNLTQGTTYHYRVKGKDKDNRLFASSDQTFEPKSPAKISDININDITEHGATVSFKTNVPTDSNVVYTDIRDNQTTGSQGVRELTTEHKIELTNLNQGTTFAISISTKDEQGTESTVKAPDLTTGQDEQAPKIENIKTDSALTQSDKVQTIISWRTDEQATTSILYKEGRSGEEKELKIADNLTTNHVGVITIFKAGTVYNFKVKSIDASNNETISNDFALLTPKRRENIIQIIIGNFTDIFGWAKF